jgi:hypothetical protein
MQRATILRATRWALGTAFLAVSLLFLGRCVAQVSLDGMPAAATQWLSWRSLFHLGTSAAALSAAVAAFLLIRSPLNRGRVAVGALMVLVVLLCWVLPRVGHFVQVDPCLNLGKAPSGQADSCNRQ